MTDGHCRPVEFRSTLIIMTSNLGSDITLQCQEQDMGHDSMQAKVFDPLESLDSDAIDKALKGDSEGVDGPVTGPSNDETPPTQISV